MVVIQPVSASSPCPAPESSHGGMLWRWRHQTLPVHASAGKAGSTSRRKRSSREKVIARFFILDSAVVRTISTISESSRVVGAIARQHPATSHTLSVTHLSLGIEFNTQMEEQLIDHIHPIAIPREERGNELSTLGYLKYGLGTLASQVAKIESPFQEKERVENIRIGFSGNHPDLPPGAAHILPCFFHWFGVSICNYARLAGFLGGLAEGKYDQLAIEDPTKFRLITEHCDDYVESISELAPVVAWRNKVAAHFAITAPRKATDNPALLDASVMYPVGYLEGRIRVGMMTFSRTDSQGNMHEGRMDPWSVTEVFEKLCLRYWPDVARNPNYGQRNPSTPEN